MVPAWRVSVLEIPKPLDNFINSHVPKRIRSPIRGFCLEFLSREIRFYGGTGMFAYFDQSGERIGEEYDVQSALMRADQERAKLNPKDRVRLKVTVTRNLPAAI